MPVSRYYKTAAVEMRLGTALGDAGSGAAAGDSVTITLTNAPGASGGFNLPTSVPFTLILDPDTSNEEVVEVTSVTTVNSTYVITRAVDSSILSSHAIGAVVKHGVSARDYAESREHEAATTGVHGVTGSIAPLASPTFTGTVVLPSTTSIGTVSATEIGYLDGVTSGLQSQLDAKAAIAGPTFTGTVTVPTLSVTTVNGTTVNGTTVNGTTLQHNGRTLPLAIASGSVSLSTSSSKTATGTASWTTMSGAPNVVAVADNAAFNISVSSINTGGCTINARHIDDVTSSVTFNVYWVAVKN